mmetsp:Transcript_44146/g.37050  ORF Transcript_44146/g.37050 Transcript_44146/m.37050 type:complete len:215 (+) Transcript_44146:443-1087(+)
MNNKADIISYLKFRFKLIFRVDNIEINRTDVASHRNKSNTNRSLSLSMKSGNNTLNDELQDGFQSKRLNPYAAIDLKNLDYETTMKRYRQQINVSNNVLKDKMSNMDNQKKQQLVAKEKYDRDAIDIEIKSFSSNVETNETDKINIINGKTQKQSGNWLDMHKLHLKMMKYSQDIKLKKGAINFKLKHNIFDDVEDMAWPSQQQKLLDIYGNFK